MVRRLIAALVLVLLPAWAFAQGTIAPSPVFYGFDNNGDPVASGKVCVFVAGTSTNATTYTNAALSVANTNPVILTAGRATIFLTPGQSYKFTLKTAGSDTTCNTGSTIWSQDNIQAGPLSTNNVDVLGTAGEAITAGQAVYLSDGSGSKNAGQWYKADATNGYSSTLNVVGMAQSAISSGVAGSIRMYGQVTGLLSLSVGSTYYVSGTAGAMTTTMPSANARVLGVADSTTSLVLDAAPTLPLRMVFSATGFGTHSVSAAGTGGQLFKIENTASGTGNYSDLVLTAGSATGQLYMFSQGWSTSSNEIASGLLLETTASGGVGISAAHASGSVKFYAGNNNSLRAAYDSSGNYIFAGTNITDGGSTPTISSGCGSGSTIAGKAYAFRVTVGTTPGTTCNVNFNSTFGNAPACSIASDNGAGLYLINPTTTTVAISNGSGLTNTEHLQVLCRGY